MRLSVSAGLILLSLGSGVIARSATVDAGYDEVGYANWYGRELAGARTASGAPFRPSAITAAHRTLPLGSYAEVTALDSGRTILVLVNDRGPSQRNRVIDLSRGAATLLGIGNRSGVAVRVRSVAVLPEDRAALSRGKPAADRPLITPESLAMLRDRLPAQRARDAAARRGYGDASIIVQP